MAHESAPAVSSRTGQLAQEPCSDDVDVRIPPRASTSDEMDDYAFFVVQGLINDAPTVSRRVAAQKSGKCTLERFAAARFGREQVDFGRQPAQQLRVANSPKAGDRGWREVNLEFLARRHELRIRCRGFREPCAMRPFFRVPLRAVNAELQLLLAYRLKSRAFPAAQLAAPQKSAP
jgi:hypothetical protein